MYMNRQLINQLRVAHFLPDLKNWTIESIGNQSSTPEAGSPAFCVTFSVPDRHGRFANRLSQLPKPYIFGYIPAFCAGTTNYIQGISYFTDTVFPNYHCHPSIRHCCPWLKIIDGRSLKQYPHTSLNQWVNNNNTYLVNPMMAKQSRCYNIAF